MAEDSAHAIREVLREIDEEESLWRVADASIPLLTIRRAVYERALELGASEETARGFLALGHIFEGELGTAHELVEYLSKQSSDPVLLSAWAALGIEPSEIVLRLKAALRKSPNALRLRRQLATEALRAGLADIARDAHRWLSQNETSPSERSRVRDILDEKGWTQ